MKIYRTVLSFSETQKPYLFCLRGSCLNNISCHCQKQAAVTTSDSGGIFLPPKILCEMVSMFVTIQTAVNCNVPYIITQTAGREKNMSGNDVYEKHKGSRCRKESCGKIETAPTFQCMEEKSGNISDKSPEFCRIMEEWLRQIARTRKYSTFIKYEKLYNCHIKDMFPDDSIIQMKGSYIKEKLSLLNLSDSTRHSILALINQTLRYAEEHYGCPIVTVKNRYTATKKKPVIILNRTEQARLIKFLHSDTNISKAGIVLCLSTGLRLGEICALKWSDIDMEQMLLRVNRTVQRIEMKTGRTKTALLETEPKSAFSLREIPIPQNLIDLLAPFKREGTEYVLCAGKPMEPRTYQNHFKAYLREIGGSDYNFHTLRHTFATNCIDSGMDIKSLSEILGHSDVQITLNRYVHPTMDTKRKHMNALSASYSRFCEPEAGKI